MVVREKQKDSQSVDDVVMALGLQSLLQWEILSAAADRAVIITLIAVC